VCIETYYYMCSSPEANWPFLFLFLYLLLLFFGHERQIDSFRSNGRSKSSFDTVNQSENTLNLLTILLFNAYFCYWQLVQSKTVLWSLRHSKNSQAFSIWRALREKSPKVSLAATIPFFFPSLMVDFLGNCSVW